mmetsp:Transcript_12207/g.42507  ORF Transcript_12207/g.42507 Transcript_12207/m.42507 type:complete len:205 (-) Transcript_12207:1763-2377(-)
MFSGHEASLDGHRGHNNIREWRTEAFGHDKLKLLNRQPHKPDVGREIRIAAKAGDHARIEALASKGDINEVRCRRSIALSQDSRRRGGRMDTQRFTTQRDSGMCEPCSRCCGLRLIPMLATTTAEQLCTGERGDGSGKEVRRCHRAAANGTAAACELLLSHKGDPRIRNKDGMTPLELAVHFNNAQAIAILRNFSQTVAEACRA